MRARIKNERDWHPGTFFPGWDGTGRDGTRRNGMDMETGQWDGNSVKYWPTSYSKKQVEWTTSNLID